ncbi:MAG: AMP-dependent synthetase, partial [Ruminococcaceae bacterium]|nr:AMP-dependent synthetase [Oscillospiraceae bacterium]
MKLAFSTLACPGYSLAEIFSTAKDFGFQGVEMRGLGEGIFSVNASPFLPENLPETKATLRRLKLEIPCLSSGCALKFREQHEASIAELKAYIALAKELGTPYIRVLGDLKAGPEEDFPDENVIEPMKILAPIAEEAGVTLLIETNGVYADTARLADVLAQIGSDSVAALWDWNHPYRFYGESPETTIKNLGAYIKYCHIKDSVMEGDQVKYRLVGEGDLPKMELYLKALRSLNYEGYLSLEWLRQYAPELSEAGIVFPHYINFMSQYLDNNMNAGRLQKNKRGDGYFVWEKDQLIDLTFPQVLDRMCEEFPDQYAFRFTEMDYTRTYSEFREDVDTFARALISMGVRQGDHVAIWATNVPQWFITFWASVKIGAVLVTVNTAYKIHEAEYLLRQSDTHTLVMIDGYKDSDYVGIIRELVPELEQNEEVKPIHSRKLPFLRNVITIESQQKGCWTWDEAMAQAEKTPVEAVYRRAAMINKHDVCNMQYTSGTTGFPKGVMLTHYNIVNDGKSIGDRMDLSTADRMMIQVPMFHCFGMVLAMTASMTHGVTMSPITA